MADLKRLQAMADLGPCKQVCRQQCVMHAPLVPMTACVLFPSICWMSAVMCDQQPRITNLET